MRERKSVVLTIGPPQDEQPWWWQEIQADSGLCDLDHQRVVFRNKRSQDIGTFELPFVFLKMLVVLIRLRRYAYVYTFECDLTTFALSFWQTVLFLRNPRHVVLTFVMRERQDTWRSRLKYALMKFMFRSLHKAVCSSRGEVQYYRQVFGWPADKVLFVPFPVSAGMLEVPACAEEEDVVSAGRVFRDFRTLIAAVRLADYKTIVIASRNSVVVGPEDNVELVEDIPRVEYQRILSRAKVVVLALQDMKITAGQTVLLDAMALGKAVIATRTAGTVDYIRHGENGLLVNPYDPLELRRAIDQLLTDSSLRQHLGRAARSDVLQNHLPHHYTKRLRNALS
jgi:glycosyltransferase involved in cell wall biosynthesis